MPSPNRHIIERQVLEVEMENPPDAFQFRNRLGEVFHDKILPRLERLFDEMGNGNKLIRVNELNIDVGNISSSNWEEELTEKALYKIRQSLNLENPGRIESTFFPDKPVNQDIAIPRETRKVTNPSKTTDYKEIFTFFLQTGRLPWYAPEDITLEQLVKLVSGEIIDVLTTILASAHKQELVRLIYQLEEKSLVTLLKLLSRNNLTLFYIEFLEAKNVLIALLRYYRINISEIKKAIYLPFFEGLKFGNSAELKTYYTNEITRWILNERREVRERLEVKLTLSKAIVDKDAGNNSLLKNIVANIIPGEVTAIKKDLSDEIRKPGITEEIYIENAGLVLLHPFLSPLFKNLHLTKEDLFIDDYSHMKAVLLTQYLVNGKQSSDENTLVLNKLLCGFPINDPIIKKLTLTKNEKKECADLLQQVIQLWKKNHVQVNGTVEGLKNSFIQRPGKLIQKENDWRLQVEQRPYDMVLNSLPWGIGIIKNPWMKGMLWVEWI